MSKRKTARERLFDKAYPVQHSQPRTPEEQAKEQSPESKQARLEHHRKYGEQPPTPELAPEEPAGDAKASPLQIAVEHEGGVRVSTFKEKTDLDYMREWLDKKEAKIRERIKHWELNDIRDLRFFGGAGEMTQRQDDVETALAMLDIGRELVKAGDMTGAMECAYRAGERSMRGFRQFEQDDTQRTRAKKPRKTAIVQSWYLTRAEASAGDSASDSDIAIAAHDEMDRLAQFYRDGRDKDDASSRAAFNLSEPPEQYAELLDAKWDAGIPKWESLLAYYQRTHKKTSN